jgi:acyl-CoA synthetase (AMP-forming)/AMP-acid ligase II
MTLSETPSKEQHENGTTNQTPQLGPAQEFRANLQQQVSHANRISVNSFNCVIVKWLVVHSLGDISCVCLACLVPQNLKQSATTPVLHWKKKKIQCGCTCVYELGTDNLT